MGWFDHVLGSEPAKDLEKEIHLGPLDLSLSSTVSFDSILKLLLDGKSKATIPDGELEIYAETFIDLGDTHWLSRYFLEPGSHWLQIHTQGHNEDLQVKSIILFDSIVLTDIDSSERLGCTVAPWSLIGRPTYIHEGIEYSREWGVDAGQTALLPLIEHLVHKDDEDDASPESIMHRSVLYSRETGLTNRREFLLFGVDDDVDFTFAQGISLYLSDLHVSYPG
ncbi:DUF2491 family protein [Pseudomonas chlororaphis]|uniref:DUF2491 family protein n=1 Tax=Pseudomonas TaxID=286 RepID=UPI00046FADBB|nr:MULTISPECIES: DUF2491 family protein [Pseudomonas]MBP5087533.1 DUF2491 family protein [Pseudomonas chlororaphis]NNB42387.1 DUF2491 family protein [Pseudomonas chlororaphis]PMY41298.1 DUF2491 domain-containing protein [Pseudomonas sp. FW306-2-2C-D06C]PYC38216.1 DUF2491 family protein [Pseudomonas chlororaphis]